ncbi:MAG: hypothetical protein ACXU9K_01350 [Thermodesulfobacteriota bacterium]
MANGGLKKLDELLYSAIDDDGDVEARFFSPSTSEDHFHDKIVACRINDRRS